MPVPGVGESMAVMEAALQVIDTIDITVLDRSPWYRTAPIPASDQPDFINGVISLETDLCAGELLARFHLIEDAFGRKRGEANAARTLDLDLLDYHGSVVCPPAGEEGLVLPHPRLQYRAFVLMPLRDIAPDWIDPRDARPIDALIESLPPGQSCRRLGD